MTTSPALYGILLLMGAGWGLSVALSKIAVSTGHQPFGLIFWQLVVTVVVLGAIAWKRGKRLELGRVYWRLFVMVAMFGAVLPDIFFYISAARLPGGVLAIAISSVPMFSLPIALMLRNEQFSWRRILGLMLGLAGIVLLIGPEASLPERAMAAFVPVALIAPLLYATEGNLVAKWGTQGLDSVQTLLAASLLGVVLTLPLALITGQWIDPMAGFGAPEAALVAGAVIHALVYAAYVWMVGRAGSVFTAQTSYLVTGFGVIWSMILLSESYSAYVWGALGLMLAGIFMVQPRLPMRLAPSPGLEETGT
ncbi:EamA-like transporter family protein [Roseovarius litorisediminis]|uniref:EamA-like transporter family protein n=1 Tax=Roseovarius litorisediminis TaxID=1312363 RepID=A0A1Y5S8E6_9RHOB|nr:DMT family transporter [Roseovarius litorisediminis]SLN34691.1 EamA-like transporter family protein [Roseovarius litorisediminis]